MARARVARFEHELGSGTRAQRAASPGVRELLGRELIGYHHRAVSFASWLEPPEPRLTLMIDLEGSITADGRTLPVAWIGGLETTYTIVGVGQTYGAIDLKLRPPSAYTLLGMPLGELTGACVALEDVFGAGAREFVDRVAGAGDWDARFDLVEEFLTRRLSDGPRPTPALEWAWDRLDASAGRIRIEALAAELGVSRRYLADRFRAEVGLSPKAVARQLRFADVRRRIGSEPPRWAEIAYAAGYADQSHLNREFRELAGTTPSEFVARRIPHGGLVGDGI